MKSDRVMKNSTPEMTGYEYFKKQNDRVLKKISLMITIRKTLHHFKVLPVILLNILVLYQTNFLISSNKIFIANHTSKLYKMLRANGAVGQKLKRLEKSLCMYLVQTRMVANTLMTNLSTKLQKCLNDVSEGESEESTVKMILFSQN